MVISFHRRLEAAPFLAPEPLRSFAGSPWFHATLRQCLYRWARARGFRRALLPDYCPEGLHAPLRDAGLAIAFYHVPVSLHLDAVELRRRAEAHGADLLVYVHPFGLRLEENLRAAVAALPPGALLVEDFAHTLPVADLAVSGHVALYAFPKLLGTAEGALLEDWESVSAFGPAHAPRARDSGSVDVTREAPAEMPERPTRFFPGEASGRSATWGGDAPAARILSRRLSACLAFEDRSARWDAPIWAQTLARRILGPRLDYYSHLTTHYRDIAAPPSQAARRVLERVDLDRIGRRRRDLAALYLGRLDPRLLPPIPREAFLAQPLLAFPVLVDDQERAHAHLVRGGIQGFRLTDRWWWDAAPPGALFRHHYLLPLHHALPDFAVLVAADRMNAYLGRYLPPEA